MKFSDIPGHQSVKERLRSMADNDRIPHALLIEGPSGTGKMMLARAMAQYIHCENRNGGDSCGECPACIQHRSINHIDTIYSFPIVKGGHENPVSDDYMDQWRRMSEDSPYMDFLHWLSLIQAGNSQPQIYVSEADSLIHKLSFTAHKAKYKVVIMWLPERLKTEAANKMLKLIEEPFHDTLFILVSNDAKKILPTIYSRTQRIIAHRLPDEIVANRLVETKGLSMTDAMAIAHNADGSMLAAETALSFSKEEKQFLELFMSLMRKAYQNQMADLKEWTVTISAFGRETIIRFLNYCLRLVRENFIMNLNVPQLNYLNSAEAAFSSKFSRFINERNVERISQEFDSAITDIAGNANPKLVLFDLAVRMCIYLKA
ncbi:ATP-binding protein [Muribaculum intestinale]|uniref:DNA polymerase III subunit delta n=1 Tax=Muribaculum intestinale TaxID=1796646 RepID=A0A4S2FT59_9BACT|nr:DNA polymerase III subunit delta' [Muribaculum intestinale]MYM12581.1 AAA family ATPase [Muribaculum intestinale]TGX86539.1 DNA polymerase III subunit delta' [Muribaculum intestinale]TGY72444.1 DNA polymerase III subunit delta' [Muribaculum intestinale]